MGDVDWHSKKDYFFASVGDDKMLMLYAAKYLLRLSDIDTNGVSIKAGIQDLLEAQ